MDSSSVPASAPATTDGAGSPTAATAAWNAARRAARSGEPLLTDRLMASLLPSAAIRRNCASSDRSTASSR